MAKQSPLQIMLNKALGVIQKGKKHIIETTLSNAQKKREAKKGALSSIFGRGVVDDVYTKANQITQAGKQAFTERLQSPAPVRMNAKETLVTKPLKVTKDLAQGFAYGAGFLTKSAVQAVGGDKLRQKYDNPEMETMLFGRPTKTLQDFSKQTGKYAEEKGSSPRQKATLQGLAIAGSLFVENPLNFSKTPAKTLFTELAQETNEQVIKRQLKDNIVDLTDDAIESIAPRIANSKNDKEIVDIINNADSFVKKGVDIDPTQKVKDTGIKQPNLKLKREVNIKTLTGEKAVIDSNEVLEAYESGGKILLQTKNNNKKFVVSKSQYQNIKNNAIENKAVEFAPELKGTVESVRGNNRSIGIEEYNKISKELKEKYDPTGRLGLNDIKDRFSPEDRLKLDNAKKASELNTQSTKYENYQLPEGKNYKEILIQEPVRLDQPNPVKEARAELEKKGITFEEDMDGSVYPMKDGDVLEYDDVPNDIKELFDTAIGDAEDAVSFKSLDNTKFKSSHWDEPNVISHLRMNERTYNGKKVSFMEELQSDWAREARSGKTKTSNPLLKNWQAPTVKRALREAVDSGADYFAWINGSQTSARYNLSTVIDKSEWKPFNNGKYVTLTKKDGGTMQFVVDEKGVIDSTIKHHGTPDSFAGKKLDEVLGKGLADKIMEKETGTLSGEGLSFGGEWASNLYDKQVKSIVEDITGGKVEVIDLKLPIEGKEPIWIMQSGRDAGAKPRASDLQIGMELNQMNKGDYIITDVLGDGKFKAVKKDELANLTIKLSKDRPENLPKLTREIVFGNANLLNISETFNISQKKAVQQGIKLTPEIKAIIRGEAQAFKLSPEAKVAYESTVKEIQSDLKKIFGKNVPIEAIDDVALMSDPRAVGELSNGVIKLLTDNGKVSDLVGKHESWHFFKRVLASKNERLIAKNIEDDLIKAFPNKYKKLEEAGYSKNRIAEELVADEFARYYRTGKSFSEKVRVFFDKMLQKFELLMANKQELLTYFKNIRQRVGKILQKDIDTVSFKLDGKGPKPVDRLIAEGKIRVVSRDGRDVYQTKQRGKWVNARDEESAVAKVTKTAVEKPKAVIPERLENEMMLIEFQKDELKRDPARTLTKYMNKNGELPEVSGSGTSKFARKGDDIAKELGFEDSESARIAAQEYLERKKTILAEEKALKQEIKEVKKKSPIEIVSQKRSPKPRITPEEVKSIEKQAQQAQEIMDSDFRKLHDVSLPTIVKQTVTPVTRKVHLIDTLFTTPKFVMEKIGFSKEVKELRRAMDNYWKELPKNLDVITDWSKRVSKESNQKIFRYLDGQKVALNPKELEVAGEIKVWLKQWADRLGLKEENRVTDYITRLFDNDMAKEFDEELAKIIADKIPGSVYSPFVLKRLGAKGYIEDTWKALDAYVKRSTRKVHMDPVLDRIQTKTGSSLEFANIEESQFRYIQKYIENINMRPTKVDTDIDNFIKNIPFIGNKFGQRPVTYITRWFRQMTYRGMLGLNPGSALRNLSQGINTYAVLGEKYTVIGYSKLFNKGSMKELVDEGVLNAGFVQDKVLSATKKKIQMLDKGLFAMFETVEKINRGAAYFGAKSKALKQGKSLEEAIEYAKDIVRKTQFVFDSVDSPVGMSSDIMKTLFQFQTFTTKQIEFLGGMIKDKNVKGLTRYTLAGLAFVYTIGQAIGMEPKEILPMYRFKTPPSLKFPVEVIKAGVDAPDKYGKDRDLKTKAKDVFKSAVGLFPGGTQIKKTLEGMSAIKDGGSFDKAGRLQFEIGDTKKDKIQAILFGKYPTKEAKEYFDKIESKDKLDKNAKKIYEAIQEIKAESPEQALESYKNLEPEEKELYQKYKKQIASEAKVELKKEVFPTFKEIRKLKEEGKEEEALNAYKALTPEQKEAYQSIKKSMDNLEEQADEIKAERSTIERIVDGARAYGIDPKNAWKAMVTKEKLGVVEGNLVGFERFFGIYFKGKGGSEEYIYKLLEEMGIPASERSNYNLEHIVPITAGGDNSPENLKVVDRATHNSWTEIDIALGRALKDKKINRKRAEKIAIDFKSGLINKEEVLKLIK